MVELVPSPAVTALPAPRTKPPWGHLSRWTGDSLGLLEEGARLGPLFGLRLWRPATVGYTPDWNRFVLGDLAGFRSRGSLSQLSPYLSAGLVATDAPAHRARRAELNPAFHRKKVTQQFADRFARQAIDHLPDGDFDAVAWSSSLIRMFIVRAFLGSKFPPAVLGSFLAPLDMAMPGPLLRRPIRIRRMNRALGAAFAEPEQGTLAPMFAELSAGVDEARVAVAAAYDTTAHALAFALWELASRPDLNSTEATAMVVDEALRLYPSGWIGSRVATVDTSFAGQLIPAGRMVLYSPYLTHRSPDLWSDPLTFRPERFSEPLPAWGYIPFAAGERTCLGSALATVMLRAAVGAFAGSGLRRISGDGRPRGGLTLTPRGPLVLQRAVRSH
ncbi:MAG: cytochrome P450 [Nakamurella sp.]